MASSTRFSYQQPAYYQPVTTASSTVSYTLNGPYTYSSGTLYYGGGAGGEEILPYNPPARRKTSLEWLTDEVDKVCALVR